jgi:malonyl-CoA O-methyltransferase
MTRTSDTARIRRRFDAAAEHYDAHAEVFEAVGERLLERLDGLNFDPRHVLDLGGGTASHALALRERYPAARVTLVDGSMGMLRQAGRRRGRWRPRFERVCGDFQALPLAEASVDLVFANLALQWSSDLGAALRGLRRIMRPRGLLMLTLPGPDTLVELSRAGAVVGGGLQAHAQELGDLLVRAGFQEPVLDTDWLTSTHGDLPGLLADLDHLGIDYELPGRSREIADRLGGPSGDKLSMTWEMLYATAWSPDEGQPIRTESGEEASVSAAGLAVRKRRS